MKNIKRNFIIAIAVVIGMVGGGIGVHTALAGTTPIGITQSNYYITTQPSRLLDTRPESRVNYCICGKLVPGQDFYVQINATGAKAASINVTIVNLDGPGFAVVRPIHSTAFVSTVNSAPGQPPTANHAIVALENGAFKVNVSAPMDVLIDLDGLFA